MQKYMPGGKNCLAAVKWSIFLHAMIQGNNGKEANLCLFYFHPGAAVHLSSLLAAYGYIFSITDHHLMVKDDASYYRFQVCLTSHLLGNIHQGSIFPLTVLLEYQLTVFIRYILYVIHNTH